MTLERHILAKSEDDRNSIRSVTERAEPSSPFQVPTQAERILGLTVAAHIQFAVGGPYGPSTCYAGKTWADMKRAIESLGVRDDDAVASFEYGIGRTRFSTGYIHAERDEHGDWEFREVTAR